MTSYKKSIGFTLIELIIVIILISVLSVSVFSRFSGTAGFSEHTYQARLISSLRNMQTRAMHDNRLGYCFQLNFDKTQAAFGPPILDYISDAPNAAVATCSSEIDFSNPEYLATSATEMGDEGVSLTSDRDFINFDGLGRPIDGDGQIACASQCKITLTGESAVSVCIESQGYIHGC
ncbi:prepilin-type N-terminal cleavage/methylation domain-containing protein [uncultured Paraglaciecola sp.]|uniref:prepilin-type N-terminal cleavage/methylation domain-containing protein n=1 Tax=uncultured Paraglaciecola sp. TaxID=1765024 RepID=UPI0026145A2B|nr:prepilin-type N-terminal cleavage/methylation domain-containing protein [uncultured Paraglaciecola sp.]